MLRRDMSDIGVVLVNFSHIIELKENSYEIRSTCHLYHYMYIIIILCTNIYICHNVIYIYNESQI